MFPSTSRRGQPPHSARHTEPRPCVPRSFPVRRADTTASVLKFQVIAGDSILDGVPNDACLEQAWFLTQSRPTLWTALGPFPDPTRFQNAEYAPTPTPAGGSGILCGDDRRP